MKWNQVGASPNYKNILKGGIQIHLLVGFDSWLYDFENFRLKIFISFLKLRWRMNKMAKGQP